MSSSAINVTDAGGQTFSVEGCATIGDLKAQILEHTGIPVDRQQLARRETPGVEMVDATRLDGKDELSLMVKDTNGGCEVAPFFLKIQNFECKFRCLVCYSGMDWEWNRCQYCCIHGGCTVQ